MGRVRRHRTLSTPELLAAGMPAELNMLEFCGSVDGLRLELRRIVDWLEGEVPGRGTDLLPAVLELVGFDLAGWYRRVLTVDLPS